MVHSIRDDDVDRAMEWYDEHRKHVNSLLLAYSGPRYPPSGSDCLRPELWKPGHWGWLLHVRSDDDGRA